MFNRTYQYIVNSDDVVVVSRNKRYMDETFVKFLRAIPQSKENEARIKLRKKENLILSRQGYRYDKNINLSRIKLGEIDIEKVQNISYLGSLITESKTVTQEVEGRITVGN